MPHDQNPKSKIENPKSPPVPLTLPYAHKLPTDVPVTFTHVAFAWSIAIDLATGNLSLEELDHPFPPPLLGAAPDGRAYYRLGSSFLAFLPSAPDTRPILAIHSQLATSSPIVATPGDGHFVAADAKGQLLRFDGKAWTPALTTPAPRNRATAFFGRDDTALYQTPQGWALVTKSAVTEDPSLTNLIAARHDTIAKAFLNPVYGDINPSPNDLHVDPAGNIYLVQSPNPPRIYTHNKWLDSAPLFNDLKPENRNFGGIIPVGDGSAVIFTDASHKTFALARIADQKITLDKLPRISIPDMDSYTTPGLRDHTGSLYAWAYLEQPDKTFSASAIRVTPAGYDTLQHRPPIALDRDGTLLIQHFPPPPNINPVMQVHHHNQLSPGPEIPGLNNDHPRSLSDKPGSLWFWTPYGFHHLLADPSAPTHYRLENTYRIPGLLSRPYWLALTPDHRLAIMDVDSAKNTWRLTIANLPP